MPNGLREWTPLDDGDITLAKVWGVLGILNERTKVLPDLVTGDQCKLRRVEDRAILTAEVRDKEAKGSSRRYSALLVVLSCFLTAILAVAGSALLQARILGG